MSRPADERDELTSLLRRLPAPEPSAEFVAGARRRYRDALEARDRRAVLTGLGAAVVGLVVIALSLTAATRAIAFVVWLAVTAADLARWVTAVGVVIDLVPLGIWASAALGSTVCVLSLVLMFRARSLVLPK